MTSTPSGTSGVLNFKHFTLPAPQKLTESRKVMDFFKAVGAVASGVASGTVGVVRAVVDVPVGMVKGAAESIREASDQMDSVSTPADGVNAVFGLLTSPLTGAVSGGTRAIVRAPGTVVQGVVDGIEDVLDD
ncbi:hypothetical protein R3I94_003901 [Phoxinus phoxinus]